MANMIHLTRCPYCNRKISYFGASILRKQGEYKCTKCTCVSNVTLNKAIYGLVSIVCVSALLITVLYATFGDHGSLKGLLYLFIPFVVFYITAPFFVQLVPHKERSSVKHVSVPQPAVTEEEKVYQRPAKPIVHSQPIELDVDEDFSSKFMKAKQDNAARLEEQLSVSDSGGEVIEGEDIINQTVTFEFNKPDVNDDASDV